MIRKGPEEDCEATINNWNISEAAAALHHDALIWDNVWPLEPWCGNDYDKLSRFALAGFNVVSITLAGDNHNISEAIQRVAAARHTILEQPDPFVLVETVEDVFRAKQDGRLAVAFHFEGTRCFERNLEIIEAFYALGVRHTLLAFNQSNSVGGGCAENDDPGLTKFGVRVVKEMERVGMLVDLSHTGCKTTMDVMEIASKPVVFTHSNAATLFDHWRNLSDEQIRACAATGGLVGVSGSSGYLGDDRAANETIFEHIDCLVALAGPEHVGLGLDVVFDEEPLNRYVRSRPDEWPGTEAPDWPGFHYAKPEQIPALTEMMLDRGYREHDIRGILGENYVRICGEVWQ